MNPTSQRHYQSPEPGPSAGGPTPPAREAASHTPRVTPESLIFPWNECDAEGRPSKRARAAGGRKLELDDETLRDGMQSTSVRSPAIGDKLEILHHMEALSIDIADLGLPAAGATVQADCLRLVQEIGQQRLSIRAACAGRTVISDIVPIAEMIQKTGVPIEAHLFIGSSSIRRFAEDWDLARMLRHTEEAMDFCRREGVVAMYVTEDTTRAEPEVIRQLFATAIRCGARRVCLSDTVGYSTPDGILNLLAFVREVIRSTGEDVSIDWHGHNDRGLALSNALVAAIDGGVDRIHGTCLGVGERAGNASIDQILINLSLMGLYQRDLTRLAAYCHHVSEVCGVPIPPHYPAVGSDAFRTSTGVHAAAIIKALEREGGAELADLVYSSVPARALGLEQVIEIGPMSGKSNVLYWLGRRGWPHDAAVLDRILRAAKASDHVLTEAEVRDLV